MKYLILLLLSGCTAMEISQMTETAREAGCVIKSVEITRYGGKIDCQEGM